MIPVWIANYLLIIAIVVLVGAIAWEAGYITEPEQPEPVDWDQHVDDALALAPQRIEVYDLAMWELEMVEGDA